MALTYLEKTEQCYELSSATHRSKKAIHGIV